MYMIIIMLSSPWKTVLTMTFHKVLPGQWQTLMGVDSIFL